MQGKGPFTVFAPTNEAFAKLPEGVLFEMLLMQENKDKLVLLVVKHITFCCWKSYVLDLKIIWKQKLVNGGEATIMPYETVKQSVDNATCCSFCWYYCFKLVVVHVIFDTVIFATENNKSTFHGWMIEIIISF